MLSIGNIRYLLQQSNMREVAKDTGIAYSTLSNLSSGINNNPTYNVIATLTKYFEVK